MKTQALAALMTLLPGVAAAQVKVTVGIPAVQVSVNGPVGDPPGPDYVWEPARSVYENGRWIHRPGYWRQVAPPPPPTAYQPAYPDEAYPPGDVVYAESAPPAPIVEVRPAPPHGGMVWIAGYWNWHNRRYHWMHGRWDRPRHGYVWHAPRWERNGHRWYSHNPGWRRYGYDRHDGRGRWGRDHDRRGRGDRDHDRRDHDRRRWGHRDDRRDHHRHR
jgi:hypothetical protein